MLADGLLLIQGSSIANLTVDSGISFPASPSEGELFFRTDTNAVFAYISATWTQLATIPDLLPTVNNQVGTTYTLLITDANDYLRMSNAAQQVVTVPLNSSVAFAVGDKIEIYRAGAGFTTISPTGGVTVNSDRVSINENNSATLVKVGTDEWDFVGQNAPLFSNDSVTFANKSVSVNAQDILPTGIFFSSDGTKMYISGDATNSVYQYTVSTPWDVSTAVYASKSVSVSGQTTQPQGAFFSSDGTKMYVTDAYNARVYQYTVSTPWDVSTAVYASKFISTAAQGNSAFEIFFSSDGTKMYVVNNAGGVFQYTVSTPWDVSTAVYASKSVSVVVQEGQSQGLFFSSDGTKMYIVGYNNDTVFQYTLSTPWDVSTAVYASKSVSIKAQEPAPTGVFFSSDGTKMYVVGSSTDSVYQYGVAI